jgi:hypothetical protein
MTPISEPENESSFSGSEANFYGNKQSLREYCSVGFEAGDRHFEQRTAPRAFSG